jgi:hypothetical protein
MEKEKKTGKKKSSIKKEKVSEIFEIEKNGETKVIEASSVEKKEEVLSEQQIKKENKIFKNIVIAMIGFALMFFVVYLIVTSMGRFEVDGINFQIVKEGKLILYKTSIPVIYNGSNKNYDFYIRTDPRTLDKEVPLVGNITFRKNLVLDVTTKDLFCGGDWTISLENTRNLYTLLGFNVLAKNQTLDKEDYQPESQYMFVTINLGNKTEIREINGNTYDMNVTNCEILPAFERLMLEGFIKYQEVN